MKVLVTQTFCFLLYIHLIYIALGYGVLTGIARVGQVVHPGQQSPRCSKM